MFDDFIWLGYIRTLLRIYTPSASSTLYSSYQSHKLSYYFILHNFLKSNVFIKTKTLPELIRRVQIKKNKLKEFLLLLALAERVGFEPTRRLPFYLFSRQAPSTTRPSLPFVIMFVSSLFEKILKYFFAPILHYAAFYLCIISK